MADPRLEIIDVNTFIPQPVNDGTGDLVTSFSVDGQFDTVKNSVELYIYDVQRRLVYFDYNYTGWKSYQDPSLADTGKLLDLTIDPGKDAQLAAGYGTTLYTVYGFVNNILTSATNRRFYISDISADRTEISLKTNDISNDLLSQEVAAFEASLTQTPYFVEIILNFGDNVKAIGTNIRLDSSNVNSYVVQLKLAEPLIEGIAVRDTLWLQTEIADSVGYQVNYPPQVFTPIDYTPIKGPNFNVEAAQQVNSSTVFQNYNELVTTSLTGSYTQLKSILEEKGVNINVDYTDYSNFVHFSSAQERLANFYYKAALIEKSQLGIGELYTLPDTVYRSASIAASSSIISNIIENFDGYEYYLYYSSESKAWPKTNSTPPFSLAGTGSTAVLNWYGSTNEGSAYYGGQIYSASIYDQNNNDWLVYTIPEYLRTDPQNAPYEIFLNMVGQHFDNLYVYTKYITSKYNADNRLNFGVSPDLVADTLKSFGLKLYQNNFAVDDLYTALVGLTPSGSTLLLPNITQVFPVTGSGLEYIDTIVSASNDLITLDDLNKSIYKRLYHNLPLLVKKKGTVEGLKLLSNIYGVPDTVFRVSEFGGKNKNNRNDWDYAQHKYNYTFKALGTGYANIPWSTRDPIDPDVADFISYAKAGISDEDTIIALDTFVKGLKANNLWDKYWAIYPFVANPGASSGTRQVSYAYNLKDRTRYSLGYNNNPTFDADGITFDGADDWIDTNMNPNVASAEATGDVAANFHGSVYFPSTLPTSGILDRIFGVQSATIGGTYTRRLNANVLSSGAFFADFGYTSTAGSPPTRYLFFYVNGGKGYMLFNRTSDVRMTGYQNGNQQGVVTALSADNEVYNGNMYLGTANVDGTADLPNVFTGTMGYVSFGYGFTDTESQIVSTLVNNLMTTVGR